MKRVLLLTIVAFAACGETEVSRATREKANNDARICVSRCVEMVTSDRAAYYRCACPCHYTFVRVTGDDSLLPDEC